MVLHAGEIISTSQSSANDTICLYGNWDLIWKWHPINMFARGAGRVPQEASGANGFA